jgi:uncharacterized protein
MIHTYSTGDIDVFNLRVDDIRIIDIVFGLSNIPRFAGQVEFYSVARHSIEVCEMLPDEHKLAGLLHDASEAYIGDMPSPIKCKLPDYLALEKRIMDVVEEKWGIDCHSEQVKKADKFALEREMKMLFTGGVEREDSEKIRERFLVLYYKLT